MPNIPATTSPSASEFAEGLRAGRLNRRLEELNAHIEDRDIGARTAGNVAVAVKVLERIAKLTG